MASDGMFRNQRTPNWKSNVVKHTSCHSVNNRRRKFHAGWIADHSFVMVDKIGKEQIKTGWNRIIPVLDETPVTPSLFFSIWDEKKFKNIPQRTVTSPHFIKRGFSKQIILSLLQKGARHRGRIFLSLIFPPGRPSKHRSHPPCLTSLIERRNYFHSC
jgi:hypothetical protein